MIVGIVAKRRLGLDVDLPGAAESVEVIDVVAAERRLQGIEDISAGADWNLALSA